MRILSYLCCIIVVGANIMTTRADTLGRLFTTVEDRLRLDEIRERAITKQAAIKKQLLNSIVPKEKPLFTLELKGLIYRSDGHHQLWLNGDKTDLASSHYNIVYISPTGILLQVEDQVDPIFLRVGNYYNSQRHKAFNLLPKTTISNQLNHDNPN